MKNSTGRYKKVLIIGAGPAGLTAAYELLRNSKDYIPVILEATKDIGGISKTVNHKGNKIDIGGHRFFSKSDRVMEWWQNIFPIYVPDDSENDRVTLTYHNKTTNIKVQKRSVSNTENAFLVRKRLSRLFHNSKFFSYPIKLSVDTLLNLGLIKSTKIFITYVYAQIFKRKEESLADFYINRFGYELYNTFFNGYTERLWGMPASKISPEWGAQRVKGVSISAVIKDSIKTVIKSAKTSLAKRNLETKGDSDGISDDISQKDVETSLIQKFLYPKYGPGQLWEKVAEEIKRLGGEIYMEQLVTGLELSDNKVISLNVKNKKTETGTNIKGDFFISTAPIKELIQGISPNPPKKVLKVAKNLEYRDFMTVGVLLEKLKIQNNTNIPTLNNIIPDNWIYIHEPDVNVLRIQIFNNWSPFMVQDRDKVWLGMEFTMDEESDFWKMSDDEIKKMAINELEKIGMANSEDVLDSVVIKVPKVYPAYFGAYKDFDIVREYFDNIENLFLIGRNGMHRYNNQDHSMLTAMEAVNNILTGKKDKTNIWDVNTEMDYHEEKSN